MSGSVNKVMVAGNLGANPEIRTMQSGEKVANLSVATSERWKDKNTGEKRERTEWHRVTIFSQPLVEFAEKYLKKGEKVFVEGSLATRSWEDDKNVTRYTTEVVLKPFSGILTKLSSSPANDKPPVADPNAYGKESAVPQPDETEDEIPF